jgi:tetratricopeptide (TPR) repeat protein
MPLPPPADDERSKVPADLDAEVAAEAAAAAAKSKPAVAPPAPPAKTEVAAVPEPGAVDSVAAPVVLAPIPDRAATQYAQALNYLRAGRATDAELEFKQIALAYPEYSGPHVNLGIMFMRAGKLAEAEAALKAALERNPGNAVAGDELGLVYRKQGKLSLADSAYRSAIAADPNYAPAHLNLGVLCDLYLGDPQRAALQYEEYLKLVGENKQVAAWLADARKRTGPAKPAAKEAT